MTNDELTQLRDRIEQEYREKKVALDTEYRSRKTALDRARAALEAIAVAMGESQPKLREPRRNWKHLVPPVLSSLPQPFSAKDVATRLGYDGNSAENGVTDVLRKMIAQGKVELAREKKVGGHGGSQPALYRLKVAQQEPRREVI